MKYAQLDPKTIELCSDPVTLFRKPQVSKFDALFKKMTPGNCLRILPKQAAYINVALRKYIARNNLPYTTKQTTQYPGDTSDTCGRVWLMAAPKPALKRAA